MKKTLRSLVLVAGMASVTALGAGLALADDTAATPAPAQVQGEQPHHGFQKGRHQHRDGHRLFTKLAAKLGLSEQQKAQAKTIFESNRAQSKPLFASLRSERQQLRSLIHSGSADEAAIRAQSAKVAQVEADLAVQRAQGAKQFRALLTPDQQAKLKTLLAQREQRHQKHHGFGEFEE